MTNDQEQPSSGRGGGGGRPQHQQHGSDGDELDPPHLRDDFVDHPSTPPSPSPSAPTTTTSTSATNANDNNSSGILRNNVNNANNANNNNNPDQADNRNRNAGEILQELLSDNNNDDDDSTMNVETAIVPQDETTKKEKESAGMNESFTTAAINNTSRSDTLDSHRRASIDSISNGYRPSRKHDDPSIASSKASNGDNTTNTNGNGSTGNYSRGYSASSDHTKDITINSAPTTMMTNGAAKRDSGSSGGIFGNVAAMRNRRSSRRASMDSVGSRGSAGKGSTYSGYSGLTSVTGSKATRKSSLISMDNMWSRLGRKSDVWEEMSDLGSDEYPETHSRRQAFARRAVLWGETSGRWLRATFKTAVTTPSVWMPSLLLFVGMVIGGLLITYGFENAQANARKQTATSVAEQTDLFFVRVLENAFVPLFTMAQFVKELPEFHLLDQKVGERCDPLTDEFNCTKSLSAPPLKGKEGTHRDMNAVFDTNYGRMIQKKFDSIASGIKANSGLGKSLANIQLAPKGVVSMLYPMVNCEDFEDGYCMNNTGAWGHDLLNDPNRVGIARATVPAEGVVTAGPLKIIQGEDTFIARLAINFPPEENENNVFDEKPKLDQLLETYGGGGGGEDESEIKHSMVVDGIEYPCWGFAVVLLNWKLLKEESNIYKEFEAEKMQFKLTRTDIKGDGSTNVVTIAESPHSELIENDNITLALNTGDNGWVIAVGYDDGFAPNYKKWAYPIVFCGAFVFTVLMMLVLVSKKEHEQLLLNLMPRRAIRKLAKGETVVDRYTRVTIFFSDIVGYTKMSSEMTPIEIMTMLNDLYSKFDALAKKHDVFKVETIGDAYVAVAGAPKRCSGPEAAEKMTLFALDCLQTVKDFQTDDGAQIAIRVGLASGAVVAGVVGKSLPKYTLFGDTVNFAARMEQTSVKMKLQICPTTHRMLIDAPRYNFNREERVDEKGELGVECKGKGRQYTYWVNSATKLEEGEVPPLSGGGAGDAERKESTLDIDQVVDEETGDEVTTS